MLCSIPLLVALRCSSILVRFLGCVPVTTTARCEQDVGGAVQSFRGSVKSNTRPQKAGKGSLEFKVFFDADGETVWVPLGSDGNRTWSFAA